MRTTSPRDRDAPQFGEPADIDNHFRRYQAQVHRRHQALAARKHLGVLAMNDEQLQRVSDAGGACVAESRGFHRRDLPGRIFGVFFSRLEGAVQRNVKFVYRTIISGHSTFGRVMISRTTRHVRCMDRAGRGAGDESGFLYHADPSSRQGLAALAEGGPRSFPARRRTGLQRSLCRRTRHRPSREHHLICRIHCVDCGRDPPDQAWDRHDQHAEHPSRHGGGLDRDARPHAGRPADFRDQPRRTAVGCRIVRQSRRRPQRDVPGIDQSGPSALGWRSALQSQGQILEPVDAKNPDRRGRPGIRGAAAAKAASAHRRHRRRTVLKGRHRGGRARLGSDFRELPDAGLGKEPLAEICRGLRAHRPRRRSRELARRQERLCRRRCFDRESLRHRPEWALRLLLSLAVHQTEKERSHRTVQDPSRAAGRRSDARVRSATG